MFDLFRSRDKIVRIMLGGLLLVVALSMLTYLVPSYNMGGGAVGRVYRPGRQGNHHRARGAADRPDEHARPPDAPRAVPHYIPQYINSMITERALAYEAQRLGFKVSDEDLAAGIRQTIPQLFQDGKFAGKKPIRRLCWRSKT